jgi:tetratricopeptide (TPR) repeat protein
VGDRGASAQRPVGRDVRFDVPALGLHDASAGEIAVAAASFFGGESSVNRRLFDEAVQADGEAALGLWRDCLQSGDSMAHHGLGYTLFRLGRHREACGHLRAYTELAPEDPWAWCWLGRACHALGDAQEAEAAYRRAIELSDSGEEDTDAAALLIRLTAGESADLESGGDAVPSDDRSKIEDPPDLGDIAARIEERTRRYSTAGQHSNQTPASLLLYSEFDENQLLTCPMCGWSRKAAMGAGSFTGSSSTFPALSATRCCSS